MWRVGLIAAILYAQLASAQVIGSVHLRLGEPRGSVLASLRGVYSLDSGSFSGGDQWAVYERGSRGHLIGNLAFDENGLSYVNRSWLTGEHASETTVAGAIVDALGQLAGEPNCNLVKKAQSRPDVSLVGTTVSCGVHSVSIMMITRSARSADPVGINEAWKREH